MVALEPKGFTEPPQALGLTGEVAYTMRELYGPTFTSLDLPIAAPDERRRRQLT